MKGDKSVYAPSQINIQLLIIIPPAYSFTWLSLFKLGQGQDLSQQIIGGGLDAHLLLVWGSRFALHIFNLSIKVNFIEQALLLLIVPTICLYLHKRLSQKIYRLLLCIARLYHYIILNWQSFIDIAPAITLFHSRSVTNKSNLYFLAFNFRILHRFVLLLQIIIFIKDRLWDITETTVILDDSLGFFNNMNRPLLTHFILLSVSSNRPLINSLQRCFLQRNRIVNHVRLTILLILLHLVDYGHAILRIRKESAVLNPWIHKTLNPWLLQLVDDRALISFKLGQGTLK